MNNSDKHESSIEKELFEEFNNKKEIDIPEEKEVELDDDKISFFDRIDEEKEKENETNKFPDMSIDEYMRQFNEDKVDKKENIFADDLFPTIPM